MKKYLSCLLLAVSCTACVTIDLKKSMVSARALSDLRCPDEVVVKDLGKDRFGTQCLTAKKGRAFYRVKCGTFPKSCKVFRLRR